MATTIKSIHIENFRSIRSIEADLAQLAVFVGRNDCGKSNILRALNLFFNYETNPGVEFSFAEDYNFFAPVRVRKAKEIVVRVEIALPETYHATNGQVIIWTKRWREDGLWSEEYDYYGQRITRNRRGQEVRADVDIPEKSNVHALLRKIEFEYVPAIKDSEYFDDLRGRIYGIISEVAARTFHESSAAFEQSIGDHLNELTASISASLGFNTRLALPRDLYHIFERLDFLSGEKSVSLKNRGDGIKARHIPLILRFMAEKKAALQRRGGAPISSIWAYEEPENNLEIGSAVQLADELHSLARAGTAQIMLTTHSPAFYDLGQRESEVALNFVTRTSDTEGTVTKTDAKGIDESLGTLAMLAPRISEMVAQVRQQEAAKAEAARMAEENCPRIFVEGESDRIVLARALQLFFPEAVGLVRFETKRDGAGHSYVIDMLIGWRSQHKHHPERPRAVGIVDGDAGQAKSEFNKQPDNVKSAKCFVYPAPAPLRAARAAHFGVYASLETLYPKEIWEEAARRNQLARRNVVKVCPAALANRIILGEARLEDELDQAWAHFVMNDFMPEYKIAAAERLCRQEDATCKATLANFEPLLRETLEFLGIDAARR
ncbi:putative ATPase (plasmid) [Aminobacter sp. MSH1]|uniref:ATP-dependent nuclease n=1 Tax=Aminobacter sp. MSH1 TaxID=374606 RepID=UPI000D39AAA8|nr:AAA family ATPase [Aminobacter sp. MSH1]AWC25838.1 putative ATPase [Aminobacter sp. MSH1]